ncbi:helix-turn-helix domain protein [Actinobacteria bacterium OK074]|nr:helix-turn-helix domain protein [Actinobacteria bacterium OK074]
MAGDGFSELLGQLKERSGLSYGTLGKRLHMSASTLHRYVNGDAVPTDYAPVERFARVCKATPGELVELHRRWVLADARRGQKGVVATAAAGIAEAAITETGVTEAAVTETGVTEAAVTETAVTAAADSGTADSAVEEPEATEVTKATKVTKVTKAAKPVDPDTDADTDPTPPSPDSPERRRRTVALTAAGVAAVALSAALIVSLVPGDGDGSGEQRTAGTTSADADAKGQAGRVGTSPSPSGRGTSSASPSTSPSNSRSPAPTSTTASAAPAGGTAAGQATAPTVVTDPYYWDSPCEQHYVVDRPPAQVPPPPSEDDARGWVTALGGVASGEQWVRLTVQGTGKNTVVLEGLHVRVVDKNTPLAWNDYLMGVDGCGGGVETRHFNVDLDAGRPLVTPKAGQQDFPYKVSETDPEVYYVTANTQAHDVSWYLELDWSSGSRHGTVRVDDNGQPFRTSANTDRPAYDYPLGYNDRWEVADGIPGAPES